MQQFSTYNNTATKTTNQLTQKPIAWQVYDLQKHGMIGNKTYKEIISQSLNPITIIDSIFKDK